MNYLDLHRHDEHSLFDGAGKSKYLASVAKELDYKALGISNHGDMAGLVSHYFDCKEFGIKPILGNEVYFMPKFKQTKNSFHLCLFVKNLKGYHNLNKIVTYSNKNNYYYKAIVDFELLEKYSEGLICTSACVGGVISKMYNKEREDLSYKFAEKFQDIFGDDYYIEIQPFKLTEKGLQENTDKFLMHLAKELDIKCILTSDSHFGKSDEFDTYLKMHEIAGHREFGKQYKERYMPSKKEIVNRFLKMHGNDSNLFNDKSEAIEFAKNCIKNLNEISDKVDEEIFEKLPLKLPVFDKNIDSKKLLLKNIKQGLKKRGKYNREYFKRCKEEYDVIVYHGFEDYFLMVQDYIDWAKSKGIEVGPGRGSACNSLVSYALGITDVDSLIFNLDFRRFLRKDKNKYPDIDVDFETNRRGEVIEYLIERYPNKAARICSYGLYKVDNLLNDLFKICGLPLSDKNDSNKKEKDEEIILKQKEIKSLVKQYIDVETGEFDLHSAMNDENVLNVNYKYDNIIEHFSKLYRKIRFYGTHAAGVAISGDDILKYTAIERRSKQMYTTSYDLVDIEKLNVIKFDMLGLRTMSILRELRDLTGRPHYFDYDLLNDKKIYEEFGKANTDGIFQFEAKGAKNILKQIECDCYQDVIAANALNRPGPLSSGMVEQYAENKKAFLQDHEMNDSNIFFEYAEETYGTFVYQEQVQKICVEMAGMSWSDADKIMKFMKRDNSELSESELEKVLEEEKRLRKLFVKGAVTEKGISKQEAEDIFNKILTYTFNAGHKNKMCAVYTKVCA